MCEISIVLGEANMDILKVSYPRVLEGKGRLYSPCSIIFNRIGC